jgi:hypothetical protein
MQQKLWSNISQERVASALRAEELSKLEAAIEAGSKEIVALYQRL